MDLTVKLQAFEGPLDLLLHLLDKNKVSIYDIPIVEITNQYLEYIQEMPYGHTSMPEETGKNGEIPYGHTSMPVETGENEEIPYGHTSMPKEMGKNEEMKKQDLNIMSEFMVMAATLLAIKSKMLLPKEVNEDGEEEDPRAELVRQLLEYKMYKCMSYELRDRQVNAERVLFKSPTVPSEVMAYEEPVNLDELLDGLTLKKLNGIFKSVLLRQEDKVDKVRAGFGKIEKEEVSLPDKLLYLEEYAMRHKRFSFRNLLESQSSKIEVIVCFLAILECMKSGKITISQESLFGDISIESNVAA